MFILYLNCRSANLITWKLFIAINNTETKIRVIISLVSRLNETTSI